MSTRFWKPTGKRRASSGTRRTASGQRIGHELPECKIAERTVREYVHDRKIALGLMVRETCVPQSYAWGVEAQMDWYEAYADLAGERVKLQVFAMRSMASGAAFHCAYLHATQQAFLEAHELAFAYFGGVFRKLRYDNLTSAVKKILRGHRREETARFVAFRSHWRFEAEFCTPAEPHEKGGIEGEAGYFRRNHWVPVPEAADLADMNRQLVAGCQHDERRMIAGREQTVGAAMLIEREHLLPLAAEGADLAQTSFPTVNGLGCVKVLTNTYSVPLPAGAQVQAKAYASTIELWHGAAAWRGTNVVTGGSNRSWIWNITWISCIASRAHWRDRNPWSRSARPVCGRRVSTGSGKPSWSVTENRAGPGR